MDIYLKHYIFEIAHHQFNAVAFKMGYEYLCAIDYSNFDINLV